MKILVINAGSSSLKFQLIDMTDEKVLAKGMCVSGFGSRLGEVLTISETFKKTVNTGQS